jgi:hypothetical protein
MTSCQTSPKRDRCASQNTDQEDEQRYTLRSDTPAHGSASSAAAHNRITDQAKVAPQQDRSRRHST